MLLVVVVTYILSIYLKLHFLKKTSNWNINKQQVKNFDKNIIFQLCWINNLKTGSKRHKKKAIDFSHILSFSHFFVRWSNYKGPKKNQFQKRTDLIGLLF